MSSASDDDEFGMLTAGSAAGSAASGAAGAGGHRCTANEAAALKTALKRALFAANVIDGAGKAIEYPRGYHMYYIGSSFLPLIRKSNIASQQFDVEFTVFKLDISRGELDELTDENISGYEHVLNNVVVDPNHPLSV